ncbi:hypothetical protein ACIRFH_34615 [Streptomyces sp. NPDC093586]|uniref:hypothetical protein n=1 Tax=Streptomyces sp. NPDC093586 TaxID=3366042 RepID=UPI00382915F6
MSGQESDRAADVVRILREAAGKRPGEVELSEGFTDGEMDAWGVPVPPEVRAVLKEIGGMSVQGDAYGFGPRGHARFEDDFLVMGELDSKGSSLLVLVGITAAGWGPVMTIDPWADECEITIEAPDFVHWLAQVAGRLADGQGAERPAPEAFTHAVATVDVAGGEDPELAALVGRGDPLSDLVDLRALPGYPCRVPWEPYFAAADETADTGSSEIGYTLAGDGRALLLHSLISGDFLSRPVRRHAVPADAAARAVSLLRSLAEEFPGFVRLAPGCTDEEMDAWPVTVPEDIRGVLREIGGVEAEGMPALRLRPGGAPTSVDPETHRMLGGDGAYWLLAEVGGQGVRALVQIRLDPGSGEWGYAFSVPADPTELSEYPEVTLLATSLPSLLLEYARRAREAAAEPGFTGQVTQGDDWLVPNTGRPWPRPVVAVREWAGSADTLLAAVAELPEDSHAADLRVVPVPSDLCFYRAEDPPCPSPVDRLHFAAGGRVVAVIPADA